METKELTQTSILEILKGKDDGILFIVDPNLKRDGLVLLESLCNDKIRSQFNGDERKYFEAIDKEQIIGNRLIVQPKGKGYTNENGNRWAVFYYKSI